MKSPLELLMGLRSVLKQDVSSAQKLGQRLRPKQKPENLPGKAKAENGVSDEIKKLS